MAMDILEELRTLDPRDPGRWPLAVRVGAIVIAFVVGTALLIYLLVYRSKSEELAGYESEQRQLQDQFREKHQKAVNLETYKQQLRDIERSFGAMLRQLPGKTEVPNLLTDISQTGLAAGLEQKLFQPAPEIRKDFYAEQPIKIRLTGSYHQFGGFVSGIAALPRIVTLHDIDIKSDAKDPYDVLTLDVTAKTYRYLDEDELAAADAEKRKAEAAARRGASGG